jgi:cysteine-rich repeat protein
VIVSTDHPGTLYDTALHVREECLDPGTQIACNDDKDYEGKNYNAELFFDAVAGESYSIIVDGWNGESGAFELVLSQPTCGNGELEPSEDCDDGNTTDGDGCEADCTPTPVCAIASADENAGLIAPGTTVQISLAVDDSSSFGGLSCSGAPSGNAAVAFSVDVAAAVEISYGSVKPTDVQVQLFANDASCTPMSECSDPYPDPGASFTVNLQPGDYLLAVETWAEGTGGEVQISIAVP